MAVESLVIPRAVASKPLLFTRMVRWLSVLLLAVLLMIMLFPLALVTINSFKTEDQYYATGPFSLPQQATLETLQGTWQRTDFTRKLFNSAVISLSTALLALALSVMNAFALGIGRVKGRTLLIIFFLMAITLPTESLAYPLYYFFKLIHLYDNGLSVVLVTAAFHASYGTYLLSSVFGTFPKELIEAAVIDGCNKVQLLIRVIVPITRPALSVLFVFFFIWTWNDFFLPLILLISNAKQTVPIAIAMSSGEHNQVITTQSAAALLGILPCFIFFVLFQRTIAKGVTAGSLK